MPAPWNGEEPPWSPAPRSLADFDRGRVLSIPGVQYRAIAGVSRLVPYRLLQRFQSLGR